VPVPAELRQNPLAHHRFLGSVVKDVDLPEAEQDLAGHGFVIDDRHPPILEASGSTAAGKSSATAPKSQ
jgi:hypothetical protein